MPVRRSCVSGHPFFVGCRQWAKAHFVYPLAPRSPPLTSGRLQTTTLFLDHKSTASCSVARISSAPPYQALAYLQPLSPSPIPPYTHTPRTDQLEQEQRAPPLRHATMLLLRKATALLGSALVLRYVSPMFVVCLGLLPPSCIQINPPLPLSRV